MLRGGPYISATALAGTPLTANAMPGPEPMPMSMLPAVSSCCSLASPDEAEASTVMPCLAKMPSWIPMSSGVKVQANGTTLATRRLSAARAGLSAPDSGSMAPPAAAVRRCLRVRRVMGFSKPRRSISVGKTIAEIAVLCHAAKPAVRGAAASQPSERRARQHHRGFDLPLRNSPICLQQRRFRRRRNQHKTVVLVEIDGPRCRSPGTDEHAPRGLPSHMAKQRTADTALLILGQNVSVTNEIDVADRLKSHHAAQTAIGLIAGKLHAGGEFGLQFIA